ncbi:unnamed protein product [Linum tenue]|uniref:Uncharacterized protein n=1 Tax=Linum tenue TaxID=586396 RepID=A0AAV0KSF2_9ROSI|nr:unnamed protein product [Linum tenue]
MQGNLHVWFWLGTLQKLIELCLIPRKRKLNQLQAIM